MLPVIAFLSAGEWAIVLLLVVLLFGATKIPQLARSLGRAKGEFERGAREGAEEARKPQAADDDARVLEAAKALGIPTEGRPIADIKADIRTKTGA